MISQIEGILQRVDEGRVELECASVCYELLIPIADAPRLSQMIGEQIRFHTLHYLESHGQGASYIPRLIGFNSAVDRAFFEIFTTVKGIGARKALRALELPFHTIAEAIAAKDVATLVALPEIGKRTAETIVAELHGKVDRFIEVKMADGSPGAPGLPAVNQVAQDAIAVLVQLGEGRLDARQLVERAQRADPELNSADALVAAAYRLKELG